MVNPDSNFAASAELKATLYGLMPSQPLRVLDLLIQAGVDVSDWSTGKDGRPIENPNTNSYRNSQWSFGGNGDQHVVCIWHQSISLRENMIVYENNWKLYMDRLGDSLANPARTGAEKQRLRGRIEKASAFQKIIYDSFKNRSPIRVIVLGGNRTEIEDEARDSITASNRMLDDCNWYVHSYDPLIGNFRIVRDRQPLLDLGLDSDNAEATEDSGEDIGFQRLLAEAGLSDTEMDALIKVRVGQGQFRQKLIDRWGGCSVLDNCKDTSVLIASHIVPWRMCETAADRLSVANGLLLSPSLDKLFDMGLITFDDSFSIVLSPDLSLQTQLALNINRHMRLKSRVFTDIVPFLRRHRAEIFRPGKLAMKTGT